MLIERRIRGAVCLTVHPQGQIPVDEAGRIRLDELELEPAAQQRVQDLWAEVTTENLSQLADFDGYRNELSRICGFDFPRVDYAANVDTKVGIRSLP
ncbi:MAG: hypothetical protein ABSG21_10380 [Spirochaetia bacterium]|jgi:enoyl-[acyl-carrier protein] reductase/trans-2-enoyl-CoA reductase (NAD+)